MSTFSIETWSPRDWDRVNNLVNRFELVKINAIEWNGNESDAEANFVEVTKADGGGGGGGRRFPVRYSRPQLQPAGRVLPAFVKRDIVLEVRPYANKDEFFMATVTLLCDLPFRF